VSNYILSAALELKDNFSSKINSASKSFKNFSSQVADGGKVIGGSLKGIGNQLGITSDSIKNNFKTVERYGQIAGAAAAAFAGKSYLKYVDLNEQLTKNAAITGASAKEQALMNKQVEQLGNTTRFTQKQVAEAQMYQAMAGYKTNEILSVTPTLLKLSVATGEDLAKTSDIVTDSLSAFGLSVKDVGMYTDVLANVANNTNTTVGMMGNAFQYVGASSRALGESFEEVAISLGILADNGIKGEKAGTGLNAMYARLAKPTTEMKKALKYANVELKDQNGNFKGLRKIIDESRPALEKMTEVQRNNWIVTVAGTEGLKIWSSIMNNSTESTKKAENAVYNATGALDKFYNTMSSTSRQKIEETKSAIEGFQIQLGKGIDPIITEKLTEFNKILNDITQNKLSTENINSFLDEINRKGKIVLGTYAALKGAIFAAAHPYITAGALGWGTGVYLGNKLGSALEPYINSPEMIKWRDERSREREINLGLSPKQIREGLFQRKQNAISEFGGYLTPNGFVRVDNTVQKPNVFNQGTSNINITGVSVQIGDKNINRDELVKEIGEEMVKKIEEAKLTQQ
jgi:TP901 family phage tail tape measure protein